MPVLKLHPKAGKVLAALAKFTGDRGALECVTIGRDDLLASDTFTLATVPMDKFGTWQDRGLFADVAVNVAQLTAAVKTAKSNVTLSFDNNQVVVAGDAGTTTFDTFAGAIPDFRSLFPTEEEPGELGLFNFELLGRFGTLAKSLGVTPLELKPRGARGATRATVVWSPELGRPLGLVMPMRGA